MNRKKIVAFAGSNSSKSINKELVKYAVARLESFDVEMIDLNDFEMPVFSADREAQSGVPQEAHNFMQKMADADAVLLSLAEHNGDISVALKNILDWSSRAKMDIFGGKPVLLMGTSPGRAGARAAIEMGEKLFKRYNGIVIAQFSLPSFNHTFKEGLIIDDELRADLLEKIKSFHNALIEQEVKV